MRFVRGQIDAAWSEADPADTAAHDRRNLLRRPALMCDVTKGEERFIIIHRQRANEPQALRCIRRQ